MNIQTKTEYQLRRGLSPFELAQSFPDEVQYYYKHYKNLTKEARSCGLSLQMSLLDDVHKVFGYWLIVNANIETLSKYNLYSKAFKMVNNKQVNTSNALNVQKAKEIPIESLFTFEKLKSSSKRATASCPFHTDNSPSFVIYKESNRFMCFSCGAKGSSIDFYMKLKNTNFITAVKEMS